ncbi:hypothetical protein DFA_09415 [Cavenderia fasciculata]|uniref:Uncharacterized protein n=1 Tax=Cavenderia fasciculata TaxID=261658 RepID=F4Q7K2_CACFS|nr:uncharacterized protein DFA_09415 [Cavenderia fasciculata]EGG16384.1 hypothetical protein DFA_09415 [Cavenderia fasciculata]|eukprot:XP_004354768.1 hypothetical protein DFA_09415 [Cavenderia fasciculata]
MMMIIHSSYVRRVYNGRGGKVQFLPLALCEHDSLTLSSYKKHDDHC